MSLPSTIFKNINIVEQNVIIIAIMTNLFESGPSFSALEYSVSNRPEFLRENRPMESHVRKNELKTYKYVCQDPSVKKVRIHVNTHFGKFEAFAYRHIPTQE